jgi:hypothetical protein
MVHQQKSLISRLARGTAYLGGALLIGALFFFLFEGMSSFAFVAKKAFEQHTPLAERRHTRYDAQLGWVNIPNVYVREIYGPGTYLRTNARGFRGDVEVNQEVPSGKVRVICSGDSFTLGYGVSNDRTWCHDLVSLDHRFETVNMGQGGYGLDQAYLWYARDGAALDHDIQIFAFIGTDIRRMTSNTFEGYPKPTLAVRNGNLITQNVPVPQLNGWGRARQHLMAFQGLQSVALLQRILFPRASQSAGPDSPAILRTAGSIFDHLAGLNHKKNSVLIVAFLPTEGEYRLGMPDYVAHLKADVIGKGLTWIDLVDDFRKMSPDEAARLYIDEKALPQYKAAAGHYTVEGNAYVAQLLYRKIAAIPEVSAKLGHAAGAVEPPVTIRSLPSGQ